MCPYVKYFISTFDKYESNQDQCALLVYCAVEDNAETSKLAHDQNGCIN